MASGVKSGFVVRRLLTAGHTAVTAAGEVVAVL